MAKLDFPGSPTPSQKYPSPAVAGQPVYTWDGEKWTSIASQYVPGTAPFDAMAYSGMQINGGMEVSQENGYDVSVNNAFVCDGWGVGNAGTVSTNWSCNRNTQVADGFTGSIIDNVVTAQAVLGANDYSVVYQRIEGYRISRLAWGTTSAQPITISFWSKHTKSGIYGGSIRNVNQTRSYAFTYTQAVSNVAQYNTITIPGDVTGVWDKTNTTGMMLTFSVASGSTFIAPSANTWLAGSYQTAPGQVNAVSATSDIFRITGVTVLPGTQAPTAAQSPNIMRPYDQELQTCRRYLQVPSWCWSGFFASVGVARFGVSFIPNMRAAPTSVAVNGAFMAIGGYTGNWTAVAIAAATSSVNGVSLDVTLNAATAPGGQGCVVQHTGGLSMYFDARL